MYGSHIASDAILYFDTQPNGSWSIGGWQVGTIKVFTFISMDMHTQRRIGECPLRL